MAVQFRDRGVRALRWLGLKALDLIAAIVTKITELVGIKKLDSTQTTNTMILSSFSQDVSNGFVDVTEFLVDSPPVQLIYCLLSFITWVPPPPLPGSVDLMGC